MTSSQKRPSVREKRSARGSRLQDSTFNASQERSAVFAEDNAMRGDFEQSLQGTDTHKSSRFEQSTIQLAGGGASSQQRIQSNQQHASYASSVSSASYESFEEPDDYFDLGTESAALTRSTTKRKRSSAKATSRSRQTTSSRSERRDSTGTKRGARTKQASGSRNKVLAIVVVVVILLALVAGGYYVWNTYLRHDDATDIQGEWRTEDGAMTVVITETDICMPDLEYSYELDTVSKQITFYFSDLSGSGSYAFSDDRTQLTITEGEGDSATSTVLIKVSDNTEAEPQLLTGSDSSVDSDDDNQTAGTSEDATSEESESNSASDTSDASSEEAS